MVLIKQRNTLSFYFWLMLLIPSPVFSMTEANRKSAGIDTIISDDHGANNFDFLTSQSCISGQTPGCYGQFGYCCPSGNTVGIRSGDNSGSKYMGKGNLDSIIAPPPDSELKVLPGYQVGLLFRMDMNNIDSLIGNVYVIKTGNARESGPDAHPLYVKLKILDLWVLDTNSVKIRMIFLWMANISGFTDLSTATPIDNYPNLSVFHTPPDTAKTGVVGSAKLNAIKSQSKTSFLAIGNSFKIPPELARQERMIGVYNLQGKLLGTINPRGRNIVDLGKELDCKTGASEIRIIR